MEMPLIKLNSLIATGIFISQLAGADQVPPGFSSLMNHQIVCDFSGRRLP